VPTVDSPAGWNIMIDLLLFPVVVVVLLLLLAAARRIERALWAMVSQLQALRRELPVAVPPPVAIIDKSTVPVHRPVVNSMFGR
jgi:hypothetical protein